MAVTATFHCAGATATPTLTPLQVNVHIDTALATVDNTFVGFGWEMFGMLEGLPFTGEPRFRTLMRGLAPSRVRVGGITADWVRYTVPSNTSDDGGASGGRRLRDAGEGGFWPTAPSNLTASNVTELIDLFDAVGVDFVFDLNELTGRNCHYHNTTHCVGAWDTSNVRDFLTWIRDNKLLTPNTRLTGFELGNELTRSDHIDIQTQTQDVLALLDIFDDVWPDAASRPPLYAPSTDICNDDVRYLMNHTLGRLSGFTYHSYPGTDGKELSTQLTSVDWLRNTLLLEDPHANSSVCIDMWNEVSRKSGMKLWLTESSSSYKFVPGEMNTFRHGFWYVASLGQYAARGVGMHARWSLMNRYGPAFGLMYRDDAAIWHPEPDYWIAVLHTRLMGEVVLAVDVPQGAPALVYAHCSRGSDLPHGAVTLSFVNPSNDTVALAVSGVASIVPREEFVLTATPVNSTTTMLNGLPIVLMPNGSLPALSGKTVTAGELALPPMSHGFVRLDGAKATGVCT